MSNNFLDNYKKKSTDDMSQLSEIVGADSQMPQASPAVNSSVQDTPVAQSAPVQQPIQKQQSAPLQQGAPAAQNAQNPKAAPVKQPAAKPQQAPVNKPAQKPQGSASQVTAAQLQQGLNFEQSSGFTPPPGRGTSGGGSGSGSRRRKKSFPWGYAILGVVAAVIIIIVIALMLQGSPVPSMTGWSLSDANLWANENNIPIQSEQVFSEEVPEGQIISQFPAAGESVEDGLFLELTISKGPDLDVLVPIPDIMNMSINEVEAWAEENFMQSVRITTENSETVPEGSVIEYLVNDNTVLSDEIKRSTPFYVVFSKGESDGEAVELPNFLTMSVEEAQAFAVENKIMLNIIYVFSDTVPKEQVISQSIKAEETIKSGDSVEITVSKGKEIIVPNYSSMTKDEGALVTTTLGITVIVTEKYSSGHEEGDLISQSIAAGTLYADDAILKLEYSLGNKILVPSFVGKTEIDVREWATPLNEKGANITINTTYTSSSQAAGTVLSQDKADYTIGVIGSVNFVVSQGKVIFAPNFATGLITRTRAIEICEELNIVPVFVEASGGTPGMVISQNISPNAEMKEGDEIILYYNSQTPMHTVPDFSDLTIAEAEEYAAKFTLEFKDKEKGGKIVAGSQSKPAGTLVPEGTTIILTVADPVVTTPSP